MTRWRWLRSRRLAIYLIAGTLVYSFVATFIPQGAVESAVVRAWAQANPRLERPVTALGLHHAFSTPVFLLLIALLTAATAACATERTGHARRTSARAALTDRDVQRLRERAGAALPLPPGVPADVVVANVAAVLRQKRLRVRKGHNIVEARGGSWGAWGSPIFHWALVALFVVLALGRATRAEGTMGIRLGESVRDAPDGYVYLDKGPLFGNRFTGLEFRADDLLLNYRTGGIDRGAAPTVSILRAGVPVKTQRVYPNNPLRFGALLLHATDNGMAATFSAESAEGLQIGRIPFLMEFADDESTSTVPVEYSVVGQNGEGIVDIRIAMPVLTDSNGAVIRAVPLVPVSVVETAPPGTADYGTPTTIELGEGVLLPGDQYLRFVSADDWVLLTVANDWSVPYIYALFCIAGIGLAVSIFVAPRRALLAVVKSDESCALHIVTSHSRRDPAFRPSIEAHAREAIAEIAAGSSEQVGAHDA